METQTLEKDLRTKAATFNPEQKEGPIAKAIESQTAKLPSDLFFVGFCWRNGHLPDTKTSRQEEYSIIHWAMGLSVLVVRYIQQIGQSRRPRQTISDGIASWAYHSSTKVIIERTLRQPKY